MAIQLNILQLKQTVAEHLFILKTQWITPLELILLRSTQKGTWINFIEVINSKGKNIILGCIYQQPSTNPTEFIDIFISKLLWKISKEDKTIALMGDLFIYLFLIGIHSMKGWTATTRHGVTRKRSTKKITPYSKSV